MGLDRVGIESFLFHLFQEADHYQQNLLGSLSSIHFGESSYEEAGDSVHSFNLPLSTRRSLLLTLLAGCTLITDEDIEEKTGGGDSTPPLDQDGDGYSVTDDCDDSNALVNPSVSEACNDIDDNCNGTIDERVQNTYYADADGDGYGDPASTPQQACNTPAGYADNPDDCDDTETLANPGMTEICDDRIDNDCDGTDNGCSLSGNIDLSISSAKLIGETAGDFAGVLVAGAGDVNDDGYADLLVGAPYYSDSQRGRVYLIYGGSSPVASGVLSSVANAIVEGNDDDYLGEFHLSGRGDINSDGYDDLAITAQRPYSSVEPAVYLFHGPVDPNLNLTTGDADVELNGEATRNATGAAVSWLPSGDGLLIGAPHYSDSNGIIGAAYLVLGSNITSGSNLLGTMATAKFIGKEADDYAGGGVTSANLNNDDNDDFVIAARGANSNGADSGTVYVVYGPVTAGDYELEDIAGAKLLGNQGSNAGDAVYAGDDFNGDGTNDLLVGAPLDNTSSGAAYLVSGSVTTSGSGSDLAAEAYATFVGDNGDGAGRGTCGVGDVNGEDNDLLIGASGADKAYLVNGPVRSGGVFALGRDANANFTGVSATMTGDTLSGVGDSNNDGYSDFLIGAYRDNDGGIDAGAAYFVLGGGL